MGYSFLLAARDLLHAPSPVPQTGYYKPVVEHWLEQKYIDGSTMKVRSEDPFHHSEPSYHDLHQSKLIRFTICLNNNVAVSLYLNHRKELLNIYTNANSIIFTKNVSTITIFQERKERKCFI